jgi:hypothetical protein
MVPSRWGSPARDRRSSGVNAASCQPGRRAAVQPAKAAGDFLQAEQVGIGKPVERGQQSVKPGAGYAG